MAVIFFSLLSKCKRVNFHSFTELNEGHVFEWKTTLKGRSESCNFDNNIPLFLEWKFYLSSTLILEWNFTTQKLVLSSVPLLSLFISTLSTRFSFREYLYTLELKLCISMHSNWIFFYTLLNLLASITHQNGRSFFIMLSSSLSSCLNLNTRVYRNNVRTYHFIPVFTIIQCRLHFL